MANYVDETMTAMEQRTEGPMARAIESQTSRIPSDVFLWAAGGAIAASLVIKIFGKHETSNFIGQWAPTLLILGLYNKLVKQLGHEGERVRYGRAM